MKLIVTCNNDYLDEFDMPIENTLLFTEGKKVSFDGISIYRIRISLFNVKENALHIDVQRINTIDNCIKGFL